MQLKNIRIMKITKMNIKSLILGIMIAGGVSFVSAQTTQTDSATGTANTTAATTATQSSNPAIDALKKQIEANPKDTEALAKLAGAYQEVSDWTNAMIHGKKYQYCFQIGHHRITARLMPIKMLKTMPTRNWPTKNTLLP